MRVEFYRLGEIFNVEKIDFVKRQIFVENGDIFGFNDGNILIGALNINLERIIG